MQDIETIGEDLALLEGIRTTRAIRRLKPDPVPVDLVRKVCEAGTFAPSGGNRQPWFFVAVMDEQRRAFFSLRQTDILFWLDETGEVDGLQIHWFPPQLASVCRHFLRPSVHVDSERADRVV